MIDFHNHILPTIDDGAVDIDESIAMARALRDFGYTTVCCTPHCIKSYYELSSQQVRETVLNLQDNLDNADINLNLWPGMEYMLDEHVSDFADDFLPLGNTRLILCEAPQQAHPEIVLQGLELIIEKGFVPLIAHPERTQFFIETLTSCRDERRGKRNAVSPKHTKGFLEKVRPSTARASSLSMNPESHRLPAPCLFQANVGSFTGYYGVRCQRQAYELLKRGVYTALGSDLHDPSSAIKILVEDKLATNPMLQKLANFDGTQSCYNEAIESTGNGEQASLFD